MPHDVNQIFIIHPMQHAQQEPLRGFFAVRRDKTKIEYPLCVMKNQHGVWSVYFKGILQAEATRSWPHAFGNLVDLESELPPCLNGRRINGEEYKKILSNRLWENCSAPKPQEKAAPPIIDLITAPIPNF